MALLPMPSYRWYYIPLDPFLIMRLASLWSFSSALSNPLKLAVPIVVVLACLPPLFDMVRGPILHLRHSEKWIPLVVHNQSARVDAILDAAGVPGKIATLSTARIINSKREFFLELASGWAFYSRAAFFPVSTVERVKGASAATLPALFASDMPAAIFGGYEPLDTALFEFAQAHGYHRVEDKELGRGIVR